MGRGRGGGVLGGGEPVSVCVAVFESRPPHQCICAALRGGIESPDCRSVGLVWGTPTPPLLSTRIPPGFAQTHNPRPRCRRTRCDTRGGSRVPWGSEGWPAEGDRAGLQCGPRTGPLKQKLGWGLFEPGPQREGRTGEEARGEGVRLETRWAETLRAGS